MSAKPTHPFSEAAIFGRLWDSEDLALSPPLARHILRMRFCPGDESRMHELAVKNKESRLTAAERAELDGFIRIGDFLGILESKARKRLRMPSPRNGNG